MHKLFIGLFYGMLLIAGFNQADDNLRKKFIKSRIDLLHTCITVTVFIRWVSQTASKVSIYGETFGDGHISFY